MGSLEGEALCLVEVRHRKRGEDLVRIVLLELAGVV